MKFCIIFAITLICCIHLSYEMPIRIPQMHPGGPSSRPIYIPYGDDGIKGKRHVSFGDILELPGKASEKLNNANKNDAINVGAVNSIRASDKFTSKNIIFNEYILIKVLDEIKFKNAIKEFRESRRLHAIKNRIKRKFTNEWQNDGTWDNSWLCANRIPGCNLLQYERSH